MAYKLHTFHLYFLKNVIWIKIINTKFPKINRVHMLADLTDGYTVKQDNIIFSPICKISSTSATTVAQKLHLHYALKSHLVQWLYT